MYSAIPEIDYDKIKKSDYQVNMERNGFGLISNYVKIGDYLKIKTDNLRKHNIEYKIGIAYDIYGNELGSGLVSLYVNGWINPNKKLEKLVNEV